ncbi:FG-GAP repeat domain-containing protein [Piscinibacter defluvii]|uniref:FG-GAP repeat domain-containing protein n=1 Tax=Piscinibacter defluvii TaxID=1796922 RepID=UPI0013E2E9CB|nr:VCBS repeat-containing protein [Piscinibacter defluvii]
MTRPIGVLRALMRQTALTLFIALTLSGPVQAQFVRNAGITDMGFNWSRVWMDIDGDGKDDFCVLAGGEATRLECYFSDGTSFGPKQTFGDIGQGQVPGNIRWADINGDGRPDFCRVRGALGSSPQGDLKCWLGPTFSASILTTIPFAYAECNGLPCNGEQTPTATYVGISSFSDVMLADVDADGRADLCYAINVTGGMFGSNRHGDLHCRQSRILEAAGAFAPAAEAWGVASIFLETNSLGAGSWPRGFYDFNGDGFADFCRIDTNTSILHCVLGGANGFIGHAQPSSSLAVPKPSHSFGAAFVDVNGDGKTDFCRYVGSSGNYQLACRISNGVGWEATERLSPVIPDSDVGHQDNRWWADVNADGLPDFCRLNASPTTADAWDMLCRLSRGDGDGDSAFAFGFSDVVVRDVEIGTYDGGRAFCDAVGNGVQTFCRLATWKTGVTQHCFTGAIRRVCFDVEESDTGLVAGLGDAETSGILQARAPLLTAYSDGAGAETRITYLPMSDPAVYVRSGGGSYPLSIAQPRSPLVYETRAWRSDGSEALTGIARYMFKDLRVHALQGSRGFRERWIFTEGSNTFDHVIHYQGLGPSVDAGSVVDDPREVGLVKVQERFAVAGGLVPTPPIAQGTQWPSFRLGVLGKVLELVGTFALQGGLVLPTTPTAESPYLLLQQTTNSLRNTTPANPRYRFLGASTVKSWDWDGTTPIELPQVETSTTMSSLGNVTSIVQVTKVAGSEWSRKTTTNTYSDDETKWLLGRLTASRVESTVPAAATQLAANGARSAGSSTGASDTSSTMAPVRQPLSPAALSAILHLLLED